MLQQSLENHRSFSTTDGFFIISMTLNWFPNSYHTTSPADVTEQRKCALICRRDIQSDITVEREQHTSSSKGMLCCVMSCCTLSGCSTESRTDYFSHRFDIDGFSSTKGAVNLDSQATLVALRRPVIETPRT